MGQMVGNVIRDSIPDHMTRAGRAAEGSAYTSLAAMRERFEASVRFADLVESRGQIAVGRALRILDLVTGLPPTELLSVDFISYDRRLWRNTALYAHSALVSMNPAQPFLDSARDAVATGSAPLPPPFRPSSPCMSDGNDQYVLAPRRECPACGAVWPHDRWLTALHESFEFMVEGCEERRCVTFCRAACADKWWCPTGSCTSFGIVARVNHLALRSTA